TWNACYAKTNRRRLRYNAVAFLHASATVPTNESESLPAPLTDGFRRRISYLWLSVTDRCDFRCVYCMSEDMNFLPRSETLSLEELLAVARAFVDLGVTKIRLTGGEPLVRPNLVWLATEISR